MGQTDWVRRHAPESSPNTGIASSQELTVLLKRGVEFKSTYDFFDPDRHVRSGAKDRWGVGFDVMPRSFLVLEALYRHTRVHSGPALDTGGYDEGLFQLHLLY